MQINFPPLFLAASSSWLVCEQNGGGEGSKDKKDKAPSPFDPTKKDVENGNAPQANGIVQNGLDDDKTFK